MACFEILESAEKVLAGAKIFASKPLRGENKLDCTMSI